MKKLVLGALLMTGFVLTSPAQKGSILVYGNVGFNSDKDAAENKESSFSINPGVGYQFTDNWTAGVNLGYSQTKNNPAVVGAPTSTWKGYNAGVFARYTKPLGSIFSIFGQGNAGYLGGEDFTGVKSNGFGVEVFPAIALNVHNGFALNFSFGGISYASTKTKGASESRNEFRLHFGQQVSAGISKNFGGKKD